MHARRAVCRGWIRKPRRRRSRHGLGVTGDRVLIAQTVIHITFLLSAIAIAYTDKIMSGIASTKH